MKKVTLCLEFRGGTGYAYINIIPSDYSTFRQDFDGCHDFYLSEGTYAITLEGVAPVSDEFPTTLTAKLQIDGNDAGTIKIPGGSYRKNFQFDI